MEKWQDILNQELYPLIISSSPGAIFTGKLSSGIGLKKRIDVLENDEVREMKVGRSSGLSPPAPSCKNPL